MKKFKTFAAIILACSTLCSSCAVGSFSTLNWCYDFNTNLTNNKYVNAVVSAILYPFEVCIGGFIDCFIFNTVEFWSGSNPLAEAQTVKASDGTLFTLVPAANGGYTITNETSGQVLNLLFEADTHTWTAETEQMSKKLITFIDDKNAIVYHNDGTAMPITLDEAGLQACQSMTEQEFFAAK